MTGDQIAAPVDVEPGAVPDRLEILGDRRYRAKTPGANSIGLFGSLEFVSQAPRDWLRLLIRLRTEQTVFKNFPDGVQKIIPRR